MGSHPALGATFIGTAGKWCGPSCSAALHRQPKTTKGTKCAFGIRNRDEGLEACQEDGRRLERELSSQKC
ncbi:unnamed protein product [Ectocarpus sp. 8 AP-2014]